MPKIGEGCCHGIGPEYHAPTWALLGAVKGGCRRVSRVTWGDGDGPWPCGLLMLIMWGLALLV